MGIEFFTGFEGCGKNSDVWTFFDYYSHSASLNSTGGFFGGKSIRVGTSALGRLKKNITPAKTVVVGGHINNSSVTTSYYALDSGGHYIVGFQIGSDQISIYNRPTGITVNKNNLSTILASCNKVLSSSIHHFEVKIFSDAVAGTIQIKIDGENEMVIDAADLDTGGDDITEVWFGTSNSSTATWDNIFIADDWQGELRAFLLFPNSDELTEFTPSDGDDGFEMINDASGHDGDSTYVAGDIIGQQNLHGYEDIEPLLSINGVSLVTFARKEDVGDRKLKIIASQDETIYELDEFSLYTYYPDNIGLGKYIVLSQAPDTTGWTVEKLNALKAGFEVA
jgi:hypothetical protein